ncbi:MAG: hypothetical protein IJ159_05390 [Prevotella sp.]|nr:hypothetical protein [Prevotella sp.]
MDEHPDSALTILDSLSIHEKEFGKRFLRQYQLRRLQTQNKANVPLTSDSLAKILVNYFDSHGNANERMLAHYVLGCTYRDMGEAPHAIDCYLDATTKADTTAKDCDFYTLSCVYSQMAEIYYKQLLLSAHIDASQKASYYSFKANKPYYGILSLDKTSASYILLNKIDSAECVLKKVQLLFQQYNLSEKSLQSTTKLMHIYVENPEKLSDAKELIDNYDAKATFFDKNHELPSSKRHFYYYKGRYYEGVNKLDSAEYYYRKVYRQNMSFVDKDPMYRGLLSVFTKRHQADSIAKYAQLLCLANDSSIAKKDQDLTAQIAASYNYNRYQKQSLENELKANRAKLTIIALLAIFSIVCIISYIRWEYYKKKQEAIQEQKQFELDKIKTEYDKATEEYEKNIQTLQMLDNAYQEVIYAIKEDLNKTKDENIMRLQKINAEYEKSKLELKEENLRLADTIRHLEKQEAISNYLENTGKLMSSDIVKHIKQLEMAPLSRITEDDWNRLDAATATYFPNILFDLNSSPKPTKQKIRVCLLVILKVQDGCIANWLDLKPTRISNIKSEINQELFGENSARSLFNLKSATIIQYTIKGRFMSR